MDKLEPVVNENFIVRYKLKTLNNEEKIIENTNKQETVSKFKGILTGTIEYPWNASGFTNRPRKGITAPILITSAKEARIFKKTMPKKNNLVFLLKLNIR